ncbi:adenylate cyclase type 2-like protein [Cricetulus griseus]|nr:adenylate cyclase type 2-like protein [Cricetulus griseus]
MKKVFKPDARTIYNDNNYQVRSRVSFFLFIIFVVYTMLPFNMRDAVIASVLTSSSHTIVLSVYLSATPGAKEHLSWQGHGCGVIYRSSCIPEKRIDEDTKIASMDFLMELAGSCTIEESLLTSSRVLLPQPYGGGLVNLLHLPKDKPASG